MLETASAGDVLYGTYDYWGGTPDGSFFYEFLGDGIDKLDGVQFLFSYGHGGDDWLDRGFGLFAIFSGRFTISDNLSLTGNRIVRMYWNGVVNNLNEKSPGYIRASTASFTASKGEQADMERKLGNISGGTPSEQEVIMAMVTNVGTELAEAGVCYATGPICGFVFAGTTGLVGGVTGLDSPYSYAVHSGPYEFHYEWQFSINPGIYNGQFGGRQDLEWLRTK